jgi:hypothetical protein
MHADPHDPGGKHRWPILAGMSGGALFSDDRKRRLYLTRSWGSPGSPYALWIGMNPSVAGALVDDPTVRREVIRTRDSLRLTAYVKCNVMDYRVTDPAALLDPGLSPCSPENLKTILSKAEGAAVIIAAWGALPASLQPYALATREILKAVGKPVVCLGLTKDGSPRHPLYVRADATLIPFDLGGGDA